MCETFLSTKGLTSTFSLNRIKYLKGKKWLILLLLLMLFSATLAAWLSEWRCLQVGPQLCFRLTVDGSSRHSVQTFMVTRG